MHAMVEESLLRQPGWRLVASRFGELLLIQLLRGYLARQMVHGDGWVRGLADAQIARAMAAMHGDPGKAWTVQGLAGQAAMSRSRFAERFKSLVGQPPMAYLSEHRMAYAAQQLEVGHASLAEIAELTGYESERVFARAFKRWGGLAPRAYQKHSRAMQQQFIDLQ